MAGRPKKYIDIAAIEQCYTIEEDGAVWSKAINRYLKPTRNSVGYFMVHISRPYYLGWIAVHRLVATKYLGQCPEKKETSHKDGIKENNHWTNLEYITHADNIIKSYREHGRRITYGAKGHIHSWETKQLMALRKEKAVVSNMGMEWRSLRECAEHFGVDRKVIYRCLYNGRLIGGMELRFKDDSLYSPAHK